MIVSVISHQVTSQRLKEGKGGGDREKVGGEEKMKAVRFRGVNGTRLGLLKRSTVTFTLRSDPFLGRVVRFTSTETVGLLGSGAQDGHLDFHTTPELWKQR